MFDVFSISASGMEAQRVRMNVIASNMANVETTRTDSGGPYRRKDVLMESQSMGGFGDYLTASMNGTGAEVRVTGVVEDARPLKVAYEPNHPDADEKGYVSYPNINVVEEMVNMISASRSFEANVTAFRAAKEMAAKALEIGE